MNNQIETELENHPLSLEALADMNALDAAIFSHNPDSALIRHKNQNVSILRNLRDKINIGQKKITEVVKKRMNRSALYTFLLNEAVLVMLTLLSWGLGKITGISPFYIITLLAGASSCINIIMSPALYSVDDWNYEWIMKKCLNLSLLNNLTQEQEKYQQQIHTIIASKQFQHAYLTHIQLNIKNLSDMMKEIRQKNRMEDYNLVIDLDHKINHYRIVQNNLVELWASKQDNLEKDEKVLNSVLSLEDSIISINNKISGNPETRKNQQEFIQAHQKFLESQGLSYLLDCEPTSEQLEQLL